MTPSEPDVPLEEFDTLYARAEGGMRLTGPAEAHVIPAPQRRWLRDMVEHIDIIEDYTSHGRDAFDDRAQPWSDSIEMRIVKLGHAVGQLPEGNLEMLGAEDMEALQRMQHRLAHNCRATILDIVWTTATRDLPVLKARVVQMLDESDRS